MKYSLFAAVVAAFASSVSAADAVKGAAEGFAKGMYDHLSYERKLIHG
jgi:pectin lyase